MCKPLNAVCKKLSDMYKLIKRVSEKFSELSAEKRYWIFYGGVLTVLAVPLAIIFDLIIGFRPDQIRLDWFPDIILVNFSVAVNLRSLFADKKKFISDKEESKYEVFTMLAMFLSIICYAFFYGKYETLQSPLILVLFVVSISSLGWYIKKGIALIDTANQAPKIPK